jgi:hypothetical protein
LLLAGAARNPVQIRLEPGACLLWFNKNSKLYANENTSSDSGIPGTWRGGSQSYSFNVLDPMKRIPDY